MPRLFPSESADHETEPWLVGLDEADEAVFAALTSETARAMLAELYEEPAAASELADRVDTSLQNARYHLQKLEAAELVTVAETVYSSKGTEMDVYAPTGDPLVLVVGEPDEASVFRQALDAIVENINRNSP